MLCRYLGIICSPMFVFKGKTLLPNILHGDARVFPAAIWVLWDGQVFSKFNEWIQGSLFPLDRRRKSNKITTTSSNEEKQKIQYQQTRQWTAQKVRRFWMRLCFYLFKQKLPPICVFFGRNMKNLREKSKKTPMKKQTHTPAREYETSRYAVWTTLPRKLSPMVSREGRRMTLRPSKVRNVLKKHNTAFVVLESETYAEAVLRNNVPIPAEVEAQRFNQRPRDPIKDILVSLLLTAFSSSSVSSSKQWLLVQGFHSRPPLLWRRITTRDTNYDR